MKTITAVLISLAVGITVASAQTLNNPCIASNTITCSPGSVTLGPVTPDTQTNCPGQEFTASVPAPTIVANCIVTNVMSDTNCVVTTSTQEVIPSTYVYWVATIDPDDSVIAAGSGLSAAFTPTNAGTGKVTFYCQWSCPQPCAAFGTKVASASFTVLPCACPPCPAPPCKCKCGNVCVFISSSLNPTRGSLEDQYDVLTLKSAGQIPLQLSLGYSSELAPVELTNAVKISLGFGWSHSFGTFVFRQLGIICRRGPNGDIVKFTRIPATSPARYQTDPGFSEIMSENPDGSLTVFSKDGTTETFRTNAGCPYFYKSPIWQLAEQSDARGNTNRLAYDGSGRLTSVTDPYGRQITFTYNATNRIATITDPLGRLTRLDYDVRGTQLLRITDPLGGMRTYDYDNSGRATRKTEKNGQVYLYTYGPGTVTAELLRTDGTNLVRLPLASVANTNEWALDPAALETSLSTSFFASWVTNTDARGGRWAYAYDDKGRVTAIVAPDGATQSFTYDPVSALKATVTDAKGNTSGFAYDQNGNLVAETNALGQVTRYTYETNCNQVTSVTDPNGFVTTNLYDAYGNWVKETDPLGFTREWTYDDHGHVLTEKDKNGNFTRHSYDPFGNRTNTTDALGYVTGFAYDPVGNLLSRTDANLHTTRYAYDGLNRLIAQTNELNGGSFTVTIFTYDAEGNRTSVTDANGHTTSYAYDEKGRLTFTTNALGGVTSITYDLAGNKISETDANMHTAWYAYDAQNRLAFTTNALGYVTAYAYDPVGNKIAATDANGHTSTNTYDILNRLIATTNAMGYVTQYEYDAGAGGGGSCGCGSGTKGTSRIIKQTDANGKVTYFKYCPLGRLLTTIRKQGDTADLIDADDAVTGYSYDPNGNQLTVATRINATDYLTNSFGYDAVNRQMTSTNGSGDVTFTRYDPVGNILTVAAPNGNITTNTYDSLNRLIQVDDKIGPVASYTYDAVGNRLSVTDGNTNTIHYAYDVLNRLVVATDAMGNSSTNGYDAVGNLVQSVDRNGKTTTQVYDAVNRRTTTDALTQITRYAYDPVGNLILLTDANNHSTSFSYDALNRLILKVYPDTPSDRLSYTYDAVGNLLTSTDQKGKITSYHYSDLYLLTNRTYQTDSPDIFTYDLAGRMLTANKGGWLDTFAYDGANRLTNSTQNGKTLACIYDIPAGQRFVTYPSGRTIVEQTDYRNRLVAIGDADSPPPIAQQTYDLGNRLLTRAYRNGTVANYAYNANNWITSLTHSNAAGLIAGLAYGYDQEGNKNYEAKLHDPADSEAYQYDAAYQLVDYKVGALSGGGIPAPSLEKAYNLDPVGNWNSLTTTVVPGGTTVDTRTHNAANELTLRNGVSFTYDATGNLTEDDLYNYAYDDENRLTAVTRRSNAQLVGQYGYDALSRRVIKIANPAGTPTQTRFFYDGDGWRVLEEQDAAGLTQATYVYGNYLKETLTMDHGGRTYYYHHQALWSPVALTVAGGNAVERYAYDAYGAVTVYDGSGTPVPANSWGTPHSPVANTHLFTGQELEEETGFFYFGYRYYSPQLGRWISRDLIEEMGGINLYDYVFNQPIMAVDLYGAVPSWMPGAGGIGPGALIQLILQIFKTYGYGMWHKHMMGTPVLKTINPGSCQLGTTSCLVKEELVQDWTDEEVWAVWGLSSATITIGVSTNELTRTYNCCCSCQALVKQKPVKTSTLTDTGTIKPGGGWNVYKIHYSETSEAPCSVPH